MEAAPAAAQQLLEGLLENLSIADADAAEAHGRKILRGLGFSQAQQDGPVTLLSGRCLCSWCRQCRNLHIWPLFWLPPLYWVRGHAECLLLMISLHCSHASGSLRLVMIKLCS